MGEVVYIKPSMQCVADIANSAKREYAKNRKEGNAEFALKCELLGMSADLVLGRITLADWVQFVTAALDDNAA